MADKSFQRIVKKLRFLTIRRIPTLGGRCAGCHSPARKLLFVRNVAELLSCYEQGLYTFGEVVTALVVGTATPSLSAIY